MEFKGTKGKFKDKKSGWKVRKVTTNGTNGYEIICSDDEECVTDHVYTLEDANLIANAPELLQLAIQSYTTIRHISEPNEQQLDLYFDLEKWIHKALGKNI